MDNISIIHAKFIQMRLDFVFKKIKFENFSTSNTSKIS